MKQASEVLIIQTGIANIASVIAGLERAGAKVVFGETAEQIVTADRVVLPGVGSFGPAMEMLKAQGIVEALRERIGQNKPTLAVCVGMQLLFAESEESPGTAGLGIIPKTIRRFPNAVKVPQLGWNRVVPNCGDLVAEPGYAYFANSYRATEVPNGWSAALAEYDAPFIAAMERGSVLACQFHPELSGEWGARLLRRWLQITPKDFEAGRC